MDRRDFISKSLLVSGAILVGSTLIESCKKKPAENINFTLDLSDPANAALANIGGSVVHDKIIVIKTGASSFAALSNICTHNGCTLTYLSTTNILVCPCHGGTFNIQGKVVSGPPPAELSAYKTSINGTVLTVTS